MVITALITIFVGAFVGHLIFFAFNLLRLKNIPLIYVQPGFWYPSKYFLMGLMLWLRKRQNLKFQRNKEANDGVAGYGIKSRNSPQEMEQIQTLKMSEPLAVDAVYFNGGNADGIFFVAATARRQDDVVQTILYIRLPSIGLLELPSLPDTWLTDEGSRQAFTASGLTLSPVIPMELWTLSYNGPMRESESKRMLSVSFNLTWKATTDYFDFDTDLHPHTMADSIAREKWSREYFDQLKKSHQTHYEQFGELTGIIEVEGNPHSTVKLQGVRDHSYGNVRDWKYFHRYVINYAHLEDGTSLCVGAISMPHSLSRFVIGYVFKPDGSQHPVSRSDFEFYDWGDDGHPPQQLSINFVAGGTTYHLVCTPIQSPVFYMGKKWDAKIHERFSTYQVNGVTGWGISEWDYRNYDGKNAELERLAKL